MVVGQKKTYLNFQEISAIKRNNKHSLDRVLNTSDEFENVETLAAGRVVLIEGFHLCKNFLSTQRKC